VSSDVVYIDNRRRVDGMEHVGWCYRGGVGQKTKGELVASTERERV
jgi:hypothetical protein